MEIALAVSGQVVVMVIIAVCGILLKKTGKISDTLTTPLSNILLYLVSPMLIINSFLRPFDAAEFRLFLYAFALGVVVQGVCVLTGTLIFRKKGAPLNGINRYGTGYSNAGFIGIPLVQASLGSTGVFLLVGFLAASGIFMWTNGAKEVSNGRYKINLKKALINPSNIGAVIGFLLYICRFTPPTVFTGAIQNIANLNTASSMLIIGILISNVKPKELVKNREVFQVAAARLLLCPLLILGLGWLLCQTGIENIEFAVMVNLIASSTPSAVATAMFANIFGADDVYAGKIVAVTTICSVITIPAVLFLSTFLIPV